MSDPVVPSVGWGVLHLFCMAGEEMSGEEVISAVARARADDLTVVCASLLGHKADFALMVVGADWRALRRFQTDLQLAGVVVVDSYVSLTEVSEYTTGMPPEHIQARLYPKLPVPDKPVFCFYPMSKRRDPGANWFVQSYEDRERMMREHGTSGRKFAGRVVQVVTGSTGLDSHEWGVTLFAQKPDDIKEVVYSMRFDEASALYGEFGDFYVGYVVEVGDLVAGW